MTPDQIIKQRSVTAINKALEDYRGAAYIEPPKKVVTSGHYGDLSRLQIDQAVVALIHACNLSGGSMGDMDLYKLVRTYLWSDEARNEMNAVVSHHGL